MELTSKQKLTEILKSQIATRDHQALKALIVVYKNQTSSEQIEENTHVHNGVGFTPTDAEFLSSLAKQYLAKGNLSAKQMYHVKKAMPKYAGQLINQAVRTGKIIKEGTTYTWSKVQPANIPSTDPDNDWEDEWPDANEEIHDDIYWRNKFAEEERKQEERAYAAKMEWEMRNFR